MTLSTDDKSLQLNPNQTVNKSNIIHITKLLKRKINSVADGSGVASKNWGNVAGLHSGLRKESRRR